MNPPKVIVTRGEATEEYRLPLPFAPTYREMDLITDVTKMDYWSVLAGAGVEVKADVAVAIYAKARCKGGCTLEQANAIFDLPFGSIELVTLEEEEQEVEQTPEALSGVVGSESDNAAETLTSSLPSTPSETPVVSGTP
jgi:hypothetical protein